MRISPVQMRVYSNHPTQKVQQLQQSKKDTVSFKGAGGTIAGAGIVGGIFTGLGLIATGTLPGALLIGGVSAILGGILGGSK